MEVTKHAHKLIELNISSANIKQLINNAKKYGKGLKDNCLGDDVKDFIKYVQYKHRENANSTERQCYLVYGKYLFIFNSNKSRLITVYDIPKCYHDDMLKLKSTIKADSKRVVVPTVKTKKVNNVITDKSILKAKIKEDIIYHAQTFNIEVNSEIIKDIMKNINRNIYELYRNNDRKGFYDLIDIVDKFKTDNSK